MNKQDISRAKRFGIIVGIDTNAQGLKSFRAIIASKESTAQNTYKWAFECKVMSEAEIAAILSKGAPWLNIELAPNGRVKGSSGSLDRFNNSQHRPYVIISQLQSTDGRLLGYKIASYDGKVKNIQIKELLAYGNRITKAGCIPVQNAIFVPAENDKREHYKSYPEHPFIVEEIQTNKNRYSEQKRVSIQKNEKTLSRLEEIYSRAQLVELKQGKDKGVDIRIYANPSLSASQMKQLRIGLEKGLNIRPIAHPEYSDKSIEMYVDCLENNIDIRQFTNPKYDIGQISELSLAVEEGLDINKMANPSIKADEMAEIRERLEQKIWKDELVKKDGSWK